MALFKNRNKEEFKKIEPQEGQEAEQNPMQELTEEARKEEVKPKEVIQVVDELPTQRVRYGKLDDGTVVTYVTIAEALTELMKEEQ